MPTPGSVPTPWVGMMLGSSTGEQLTRSPFMHLDDQEHDALRHYAVLKELRNCNCLQFLAPPAFLTYTGVYRCTDCVFGSQVGLCVQQLGMVPTWDAYTDNLYATRLSL